MIALLGMFGRFFLRFDSAWSWRSVNNLMLIHWSINTGIFNCWCWWKWTIVARIAACLDVCLIWCVSSYASRRQFHHFFDWSTLRKYFIENKHKEKIYYFVGLLSGRLIEWCVKRSIVSILCNIVIVAEVLILRLIV